MESFFGKKEDKGLWEYLDNLRWWNSMTCIVIPTGEKICDEVVKKYKWRCNMATCDEWKMYLVTKKSKFDDMDSSDMIAEIRDQWWRIAVIRGRTKDGFSKLDGYLN
jgi:hypothetical protein